jgi:hypothetical protein
MVELSALEVRFLIDLIKHFDSTGNVNILDNASEGSQFHTIVTKTNGMIFELLPYIYVTYHRCKKHDEKDYPMDNGHNMQHLVLVIHGGNSAKSLQAATKIASEVGKSVIRTSKGIGTGTGLIKQKPNHPTSSIDYKAGKEIGKFVKEHQDDIKKIGSKVGKSAASATDSAVRAIGKKFSELSKPSQKPAL